MPGHDEPGAQYHERRGFVHENAQGVGQHPLKGGPPFLDAGNDPFEPGTGQHDAGRRLGDIGRGRDRDAHLRLAQGRRVVGPVAAHPDGVSSLLEGLDQSEFVLREDAGIDREILGADPLGDLARRTDGPLQPDRLARPSQR